MVALQRQVQAVDAVLRQLDRKPRLPQSLPQVVAGLCLVLNDQDLQIVLPPLVLPLITVTSLPILPDEWRNLTFL